MGLMSTVATLFYAVIGSSLSTVAMPPDHGAYVGCMQVGMTRMAMPGSTSPHGGMDASGAAGFQRVRDRCAYLEPDGVGHAAGNATGSPVDVIVG